MMAPNRKQIASEGGAGVLTKYAADLGCIGGLDTIPPHQYKSEQDRRYRLHRRLLAWLRDHTLPYRSHYAVDAKGKPLTLKHAAAHLDVDDLPAIHHAWRDMEKENRVYRGTGVRKVMASIKGREVFAAPAPVGSLCLSGYFEMPPLFVQTNDSSTKQRDLAHLTPELRAEFLAEEKLDKEVFDLAHKRWLAALRFRMDQKENSRCARYAVKCLRAEKYGDEREQAKRRAAVQELLPHIEEFVQTIEQETVYKSSPGLVHTTAAGAHGHLNARANGSYKTVPPVLSDSSPERRGSSPERRGVREKKLASYPESLRTELHAISERQRRPLGEPNAQTCLNLWLCAQQCAPGCDETAVLVLADQVIRENPGLTTWGGVVIEFRREAEAGARQKWAVNGGAS
jgi:hypothetical protein